jgi:hypothetical protein
LSVFAMGTELINVYMPTNYNTAISLTKFSKASDALRPHLESLEYSGKKWVMAGDFNCNPEEDNILSDILINSLPTSFQIWPKSCDFTYIPSSGHASNIDHVLSCRSIPGLPIPVYTDDPFGDHFGLSLHLLPSQNINIQKTRRWVPKKNWNKCDADLYMATVSSILSCI